MAGTNPTQTGKATQSSAPPTQRPLQPAVKLDLEDPVIANYIRQIRIPAAKWNKKLVRGFRGKGRSQTNPSGKNLLDPKTAAQSPANAWSQAETASKQLELAIDHAHLVARESAANTRPQNQGSPPFLELLGSRQTTPVFYNVFNFEQFEEDRKAKERSRSPLRGPSTG
jgi:hypothetical protein